MDLNLKRLTLSGVLAFLVLTVIATPLAWANNEYTVDWVKGQLILRTTRAVDAGASNAPVAVHMTEREADYALPQIVSSAMHRLQRNSAGTVGHAVSTNPELAVGVSGVVPHARRSSTHRSTDLSHITVEYSLPLFPAATELFGVHRSPSPLPLSLRRVPTREFSGVVVYVADRLTVHGTTRREHLAGALFPRVYDTDMELVLDASMIQPEYLSRWGVAAYSTDPNAAGHEERIGTDPLRILARGVFGTTPTDPVISAEDAARILGHEANRRLLSEGRVVFVIAEPSATVQLSP